VPTRKPGCGRHRRQKHSAANIGINTCKRCGQADKTRPAPGITDGKRIPGVERGTQKFIPLANRTSFARGLPPDSSADEAMIAISWPVDEKTGSLADEDHNTPASTLRDRYLPRFIRTEVQGDGVGQSFCRSPSGLIGLPRGRSRTPMIVQVVRRGNPTPGLPDMDVPIRVSKPAAMPGSNRRVGQ